MISSKITLRFTGYLCIIMILITLVSCSQQAPTALENGDNGRMQEIWAKKSGSSERSRNLVYTESIELDNSALNGYSQTGAGIAYWWKNKEIYRGTGFSLPNGSSFSLSNGALSAPSGTPAEQDIEIKMTVSKNALNNELIVSFGPSGCVFDPPAEVWIDWSDIGTHVPILYYIDANNGYVQQEPNAIYVYEKKIVLFITHFSRYAVAYSD